MSTSGEGVSVMGHGSLLDAAGCRTKPPTRRLRDARARQERRVSPRAARSVRAPAKAGSQPRLGSDALLRDAIAVRVTQSGSAESERCAWSAALAVVPPIRSENPLGRQDAAFAAPRPAQAQPSRRKGPPGVRSTPGLEAPLTARGIKDDSAGRVDLVTIPGGAIDYQYYPAGSTAVGTAPGRLSALLGPYGTNLAYQYDGPLTTRTTWSGDVAGDVVFAYNTDFDVSQFTTTGASGTRTVFLGYDRDRLFVCASPTTCNPAGVDALRVTRRSDNGFVSRIDLGNVREDMTYNTFGELAAQVATYSSSPLASFTYDQTGATRDTLGRIVQKTEVVQGTTRVWRYSYDNLNRLTQVFLDGDLHEEFGYDLNGNRTTYSSVATGTIAGAYDDQDRLLSYGDWSFTYGANGELESKTNVVTGDVWLYEYDVLGNLLSVTLPNGDLVEYLVDGQGRRVGRKLNGVFTNRWLYQDGLRPIAELDPSGTLIAAYVYGTKSNVPDMIIRQGKFYRVLSDQLGSPRLVVNMSDAADVPFRADYSAFGEVTGTGLGWMPFGFAGGIYDAATGLVRFGARDYDPSVGRWTAKDPIRWAGKQANLYVYVGNDPVNFADPTGRELLGWVGGGMAGLGALGLAVGAVSNPVGWGLIVVGAGLSIYDQWDEINGLLDALNKGEEKAKKIQEHRKKQEENFKELDELQNPDADSDGGSCP